MATVAGATPLHPGEAEAAAALPGMRWRKLLPLGLMLPFFGQMFAYVKDLLPLWAISKAFPLLSLPFILFLVREGRPFAGRQVMLTFAWLVLVPSFIAISTFDQNFFRGLTAQVKLLPILYFFSFLGFLCWLRPSLSEITATFLFWGALVFVAILLLWALAPQDWYGEHYVLGEAPTLSRDGRGNRIRMPMFFGSILAFYCFRRFAADKRPIWLVAVGIMMLLLTGIVRQRTIVVGWAAILAINSIVLAGPWLRIGVAALTPAALWGLFQVPYVASVFDTTEASGFDVRRTSTQLALETLGDDPLRWIFGVGTLSPLDPGALMTWFNHFFFLADITWLGIVFEFGIVGAILLLVLPLRALVLAWDVRRRFDTPFLAAVQDILLYLILVSPLNPITLAPGEVTMLLAFLVYVRALIDRADEDAGTAGHSPARPIAA
ncbi:MAG: hypothetical protein PGN09_06770 [Sphingomonas fennica]